MSQLDALSEKRHNELELPWVSAFNRDFFCCLDEVPYAVLYSNKAPQPNIPVNVLVGFEILKSGGGYGEKRLS